MIRFRLLLVILFILFGSAVHAGEPNRVFKNGRVIVGDGTVLEQGSVVVAGDRIIEVTEDPVQAPKARRIDASGKTVLPGLIDAHVHITPPPGKQDSASLHRYLDGRLAEELRSFLEHGVTTLRSTGDYWPWSGELRDRIAAGEVLSPRVVTAGPVFTAEGAHPATTVCSPDNSFCRRRLTREITTPAQAQEAVRRVAKAGVDFIKLVSDSRTTGVQIEDKVVEAIVVQAHREGLEAVGHVSEVARMEAYAEMGLDGFVHPPLIPVSDDQTRRLGRVLAMHGTPVTTTLLIPLLHADKPVGPVLEGASPLPESLASMSRNVAVLAEEGVSIVVGSDWFVADRHPALRAGAVTHTEMELLQRGGMSEGAIIRAATANAAQALGLGDRVGTLEPGKLADLIVVDGNPLEDISVLHDVELVVKKGEILVEANDGR